MGIMKTLTTRAITLVAVLILVLFMVVTVLGATGLSDKLLGSIVSEAVRAERQSLAQEIRDPDELNRVMEIREQELIKIYGLDVPWYGRLPQMAYRVLILDLGNARYLKSFKGSRVIGDIVLERLPNTLLLMTSAIAISAILGLVLGVKIGTHPGTRRDRGLSYFSAISFALPTWWTGILLILVCAFWFQMAFGFKLFPPGGMYSTPPPTDPWIRALDVVYHAALPVLTLVVALVGSYTYTARTIVLNIAQEDFVTVARAKGVPEKLVERRYIMRVAAPPILTNIIIGLAGSIGGAILTEAVFNWPGMGTLYYQAILQLDEAVIIALTYIFTLVYVAGRFLLEVLYVILDPRVRY